MWRKAPKEREREMISLSLSGVCSSLLFSLFLSVTFECIPLNKEERGTKNEIEWIAARKRICQIEFRVDNDSVCHHCKKIKKNSENIMLRFWKYFLKRHINKLAGYKIK